VNLGEEREKAFDVQLVKGAPSHDVGAVLERRDSAEPLRLALRAVHPCSVAPRRHSHVLHRVKPCSDPNTLHTVQPAVSQYSLR
jgi:hypothetical protein